MHRQGKKYIPIVSLYKKGNKRDPLNYRPVSLTSILCKLYEKLFRKHLLGHIENKIIDCQHGFVDRKFFCSKFVRIY